VNKTRALSAAALPLAVAALLSCKTNHAPDVPAVPSGPEYCYKDTVYTFRTTVIDPDGDSMAVRFDWGDSTTSYWVGWFASGETVAFTHAWSDTGTYDVRVSAQDHLLTSEASEARTVQVTMRLPPDTPGEPSGPGVGGKDTLYYFQAGAGHPEWLRVAMRFAWGDGDTSNWSEFVLPYGPVEMSHFWSASDTYLVRAQARDTYGLTSQWSEPHDIVIRPPGWSRLMMVGQPMVTPDGSGFLIRVANEGTDSVSVSSLKFLSTSDAAYLRSYKIDVQPVVYLGPGVPGIGPGDSISFTPVTIAPDMVQLVELYLADFRLGPQASDPLATVSGRTFVLRFSDGSVIAVTP
jgi:hypothetical protein